MLEIFAFSLAHVWETPGVEGLWVMESGLDTFVRMWMTLEWRGEIGIDWPHWIRHFPQSWLTSRLERKYHQKMWSPWVLCGERSLKSFEVSSILGSRYTGQFTSWPAHRALPLLYEAVKLRQLIQCVLVPSILFYRCRNLLSECISKFRVSGEVI